MALGSIQDNTNNAFVESPTRVNKTAVEVVDSSSPGPFAPPLLADYVSSTFAANVQTVIYKSGGSGGTVLKTITVTYTGCDFVAVVS
jgi:hypothetical protein